MFLHIKGYECFLSYIKLYDHLQCTKRTHTLFRIKLVIYFDLGLKNHFRSWIYTLGDTKYKNSSFKGLFIIIKKSIIITETLKINQYFNNIICPIYRNKAQLVVGKCPWQWKSVTGSISPATESPEGSSTSNFPQHGTYINW